MAPTKKQSKPPAMNAETRKGEQPAAAPTEEEVWDEELIEQALKVSKEMHIQVLEYL